MTTELHLWLDTDGAIAGTIIQEKARLVPEDRAKIAQALADRYHKALLNRRKDQLLEELAVDAQAQGFQIIYHEEPPI